MCVQSTGTLIIKIFLLFFFTERTLCLASNHTLICNFIFYLQQKKNWNKAVEVSAECYWLKMWRIKFLLFRLNICFVVIFYKEGNSSILIYIKVERGFLEKEIFLYTHFLEILLLFSARSFFFSYFMNLVIGELRNFNYFLLICFIL